MITRFFRRFWFLSGAIIMFFFVFGVSTIGQTAEKKAAADVEAERLAKEKELAQEKMRKLIQEAKNKLNNTAWQIELKQAVSTAAPDIAGKKQKKASVATIEKDIISFRDNKIDSSSLMAEGFSPTNYTVRLKGKDNDITIWETMQTSQDKGVAFWRGEIEKDVMRGVLSWQVSEEDKRDYTFTSVKKEGATPSPVPATPVPVTTPAVPPLPPAPAAPTTPTAPVATPTAAPETAVSTSQPAATTATGGGEVAAPKTGTEASTAVQKEEKTKKKGLWGR
jgi:hypothetical protein